MTQYLECEDCGTSVPWYYGFEFKRIPFNSIMHPYCRRDVIDEEGCGATLLAIAIDLAGETLDDGR